MLVASAVRSLTKAVRAGSAWSIPQRSEQSPSAVEEISFAFSGYPDILARLKSCSEDESVRPDSEFFARIVRICCSDSSFAGRDEATLILLNLLVFGVMANERLKDMMYIMVSRVMKEATSLDESHLTLYRLYRRHDPQGLLFASLESRSFELSEKIPHMSDREVALWLDILTSSNRPHLPFLMELKDRAISLLVDTESAPKPNSVSYLLRSLSYTPNLTHAESRYAILGAFKQIIPGYESFNLQHALIIMRSIRRMYPAWQKHSSMSDFMELIFAEIFRNFHLLKSHDLVDSMIVFPKESRFRQAVLNRISELTPRQISLVTWSLSKVDDSDVSESFDRIIEYMENSEADRIASFESRDWALLVNAISKKSFQINPEKSKNILDLFFSQKIKLKTFQEISMILAACINLTGPKDPRITDLLRQLPDLVQSSRTNLSTSSILSTLRSLSVLKIKVSTVSSDLARILYARASRGELSPDQAAFALFLLANDIPVATSFFPHIDVCKISNNNLINFLNALSRMKFQFSIDPVLDELYNRSSILKPDQVVEAVLLAASLEVRQEKFQSSNLLNILRSETSLSRFTPESLVQIFVNLDPILSRQLDPENILSIRNALSVAMIDKLKTSSHSHWGGDSLILLGQEFVRLGRSAVKPNLRDRFLVRLMIAIKSREISTPLLLTNLKLIDSLGTFHQLPIHLQEHLYKKATPQQRQGVRRPRDIRDMDRNEERGKMSRSSDEQEEPVETEYEEDPAITPVSKFIQKIRNQNS